MPYQGEYANGGNLQYLDGAWRVPPNVDLGWGLGVAEPGKPIAAPAAVASPIQVANVQWPGGAQMVAIGGTQYVVTDLGSNEPGQGWRNVNIVGYAYGYLAPGGSIRSSGGGELGRIVAGSPTTSGGSGGSGTVRCDVDVHEGALVRKAGGRDVYAYLSGSWSYVPDEETMRARGWSSSQVQEVQTGCWSALTPFGPAVPSSRGAGGDTKPADDTKKDPEPKGDDPAVVEPGLFDQIQAYIKDPKNKTVVYTVGGLFAYLVITGNGKRRLV